MKHSMQIDINGESRCVDVDSRDTLADALREQLQLTGTHINCEIGICGHCTILLDDLPVRACLVLAYQADGRQVRTVEGLADGEQLNPIQAAMIEHGGLQCGFCTPGFVTLLTWATERGDMAADSPEMDDVIASNLCRCTGYQGIRRAVRSVLADEAE